MTPGTHALPIIDPALFGPDAGGPDMVVVDLRAPRGDVDPFDVIRDVVESGRAACLYDRQGEWSDCVVAEVDGALFVVTAAGRATFSDLGAALRHGLTRPPPPQPAALGRPARRRFRRLLARLGGAS